MKNDDTKNASEKPTANPALEKRLREELEPGETILWQGTPVRKIFTLVTIHFFVVAFVATFFFVLVFGIALFSESQALDGGVANGLTVFGFVFLCVVIFLWTLPVRNCNVYKRVLYAITNKRALVVSKAVINITTTSYYPGNGFGIISTTENRRKIGNIMFSELQIPFVLHSVFTYPGFMNIRNPREVERVLKAMISENAK